MVSFSAAVVTAAASAGRGAEKSKEAAEAAAESGGSSSAAASSERLCGGGRGESFLEDGDEVEEAPNGSQAPSSILSRLAAPRMTSALLEGRERSSCCCWCCCLLPCCRRCRSAAELLVLGIDFSIRVTEASPLAACFALALAQESTAEGKERIAIGLVAN